MEFALLPNSDGNLYVFESGVNRGIVSTYTTADVFRVAVEGGVVKYRKNGVLVYTSTIAPTYPLLVDAGLYHNGGTQASVVISGNLTGGGSPDINWLVTDQLGTPRMVFDKTGALAAVKRHDYLPFGEEVYGGSRTTAMGYGAADGVRQKFTSQERDNETGLDYMHARYFASAQGRFSSADSVAGSIGNPQSLNRYAYVGNNPLNFSDPSGHDRFSASSNGFGETMGQGGYMDPDNDDPTGLAHHANAQIDSWLTQEAAAQQAKSGSTGYVGDGIVDASAGETSADEGNRSPQNLAALSDEQDSNLTRATDVLASKLASGVSQGCQENVIDKLKGIGFNLNGFINFLGNNPRFYNGVTSTAPVAGTVSPKQPADLLYGPGATIADVFKGSGNTRPNALTSITSATFLSFLRPDAITGSGIDTQSLVWHEGIHGFTRKVDADVQNALGIKETPVSRNITDYIKKHCF
jgi:RHS repeat-associated protein